MEKKPKSHNTNSRLSSNKRRWPAIITALLVFAGCTPQSQQDCAPQTLARLSQLPPIEHATSATKFAKLMHWKPDGVELPEIPNAWNTLYPDHPLIAIHSTIPDTLIDYEYPIQFSETYLWVGKHPQGDHVALLRFTPQAVILSHSQRVPGTTNYYEEHFSLQEIFTNSFYIFRVSKGNEILKVKPVSELYP